MDDKLTEMQVEFDKLNRAQMAWLEKHKDADLIECNTYTKRAVRAIYYSPQYKFDEPARRFFQLVREMEDDPDGR